MRYEWMQAVLGVKVQQPAKPRRFVPPYFHFKQFQHICHCIFTKRIESLLNYRKKIWSTYLNLTTGLCSTDRLCPPAVNSGTLFSCFVDNMLSRYHYEIPQTTATTWAKITTETILIKAILPKTLFWSLNADVINTRIVVQPPVGSIYPPIRGNFSNMTYKRCIF